MNRKNKPPIYPIRLNQNKFEDDLAYEIARIANLSRRLGCVLRAEKREMTPEEAYIQLDTVHPF